MSLSTSARQWLGLALGLCAPLAWHQAHAVTIQESGLQTIVTGERYRLAFVRESTDVTFELKGGDNVWRTLATPSQMTLALMGNGQTWYAAGARATWALSARTNSIVVGQQAVMDRASGTVLELHYWCRDEGVLLGTRVLRTTPNQTGLVLWSPPRLTLAPNVWDRYAFWDAQGKSHARSLAELTPLPGYAGVSPWEQQGDVVAGLDPAHPAITVFSTAWQTGLGAVLLDYPARWPGATPFLQRHTAAYVYLYAGYAPTQPNGPVRWAWLAPLQPEAQAAPATQVEALVNAAGNVLPDFTPTAKPVPDAWLLPPPTFPADLLRSTPVTNLNDAVVFTMAETTSSDSQLALAHQTGSDLLVRGWFKWNQAPPVSTWSAIPPKARALGALFGGGITCSALYDGENGLSQAQWLEMATRGPDGALVDAWGQPGVRHGSLSSPAYLDYLFRWCREQMDAGVDYLFMDEHTAALGTNEGYDDGSLADFRQYLLQVCPVTQGWTTDDPRWKTQFQIDLANGSICPDGTMGSFNYRGYLRAKGWVTQPDTASNPLASWWQQGRAWRDDRAWKGLTDRIHAYGTSLGRNVAISANGLARYVDLQVLGVWNQWLVRDGQIDLSQNQLAVWRGLLTQGHELAGAQAPVVLFHDWGFGDTPFPWMAVAPSQREIWLRTRAPEIYASGAKFAFPVLGPFGCDVSRDGTHAVMVRQAIFLQTYRDLYRHGKFLGLESVRSAAPWLSLAAWAGPDTNTAVLHVINRHVQAGALVSRSNVVLELPLDRVPEEAYAVSPDWDGQQQVACVMSNTTLQVTLPILDAFALVWLRYANPVSFAGLKDPVRVVPTARWERQSRNEFPVRPDGSVEGSADLNGFLQGMLHTGLRNPPTFLLDAATPGTLHVRVSAVAMGGARLICRIDGRLTKAYSLPDLDGKNDSGAAEYDRTFDFAIPAGRHRLTLDNDGADWLVMPWLQFEGAFHLTASAAKEGDRLRVSCNGLPEQTYELQCRSDLLSGAWASCPEPVQAPGQGEFSVEIPAAPGARFYRVVSQSP